MRDFRRVLTHLRQYSNLSIFRLTAVVGIAALVVSLIPPITVTAAGETITGGSNKTGLADEYIDLTGLTVNGDPDDTVPVSLHVDRGILSMTVTTGLTFDTGPTGSALDFEGTVSDVNAALATLRYRTVHAGTVNFTALITAPDEVFFPGNGHVYEIVGPSDISSNDALVAAAARTKHGAQGYLATITTQAEQDYVGSRLGGDGWFGASDDETEGDWKWITGPETGTSFWNGMSAPSGTPVGGLYSNWAWGEPNDVGGENCAQFYSDGTGWNDLDCEDDNLEYYIVEYGAPGDLPGVQKTSFTITTSFPSANDVPIGNCLDLIDVQANQADHRFDRLFLTNDIDCTGETLTPMFNEVDPDFGSMGFHGEFAGTTSHQATGFFLGGNYCAACVGIPDFAIIVANQAPCAIATIYVACRKTAFNKTFNAVLTDQPANIVSASGNCAGCIGSSNAAVPVKAN